MPRDASELARRLARDAEAVCRHYLSNGRRQGRYWTVGDVRNTPGRSMFVRLSGPESGPCAESHRSPKPVCPPVPAGSPEAAQRLFAMAQPIRRTLVETYLCNRAITM